MKKAILYARVSSKEQEREGHSIPAQLELLREYAKRQGLQVVQEYTEAETAKSAGRDQFGVMLRALKEKGAPKILLVEKTDRLYRNFRDYIALEDLIYGSDLAVHFVKESEILDKEARSHLKFIHGIKVLMAKNYIDNLSEEVKKGQRQTVMEGYWPFPPPYGYMTSEKKGLMVPNPDEAPLVRKAFALYAAGNSIYVTIDKLAEMGYRYRSYSPRIGKTKLAEMLKNRIYAGDLEYHEEIFPGQHEPLIDRATWIEVQHGRRKGNRPVKNTRQDFTYRGVLTCGECNSPLVGEHKKGGRYTYYRCVAMKRGCSQGYINESRIDEQVKHELSRLLVVRDMRAELLEAVHALDETAETTYQEERLALDKAVEKARTAQRKAYHDNLEGRISDDLWNEVSATYQEKIDTLLKKRESLHHADTNFMQTSSRLLELPERLAVNWKWANSEEKQVLLTIFSSNFSVMDGKVSLELKEPFSYLSSLGSCPEWRGDRDTVRTGFIKFLVLHSETIDKVYSALAA